MVAVDGTTHGRLADAQAIEHFDLSSRGAAAVAAHRRHDEGLTARLFDKRDQFAGDKVDAGDAAAAKAERDAFAPDLLGQPQPPPFGVQSLADIKGIALGQTLLYGI